MFEYKRSDDAVQKAADWLTKLIFRDAYLVSDQVAWERDGAAHEWLSLDGLVEYMTEFVAIAREGKPPVYLATFKAGAGLDLKRVQVKIKVKKAGAIHEQLITLDRLGERPQRIALDGIPLKPKRARSKQGIKLGDVYLKLVSAINSEGVDLVRGRKVATIFSPTCSVATLQHYAVRWGEYWNVDEIVRAKQATKNLWYRRLVQSAGQLWRPLRFRRLVFYCVANPFALSVAFWTRNIVVARTLRPMIDEGQVSVLASVPCTEGIR